MWGSLAPHDGPSFRCIGRDQRRDQHYVIVIRDQDRDNYYIWNPSGGKDETVSKDYIEPFYY